MSDRLLGDGPLTVEKLAEALDVDADKLGPLMYILVETGLLAIEGERFANSPEADHYLVKGNSSYMGANFEAFAGGFLEPSLEISRFNSDRISPSQTRLLLHV